MNITLTSEGTSPEAGFGAERYFVAILVVCGAGYIGSHTARLLRHGYV